jgi:hypothetical protein
MWNLIIGTVLLSIVHAAIPNHWLPVVALSRSEKWQQRETLSYVFILSLAHITSTVLIGFLIGWLGISLSNRVEMFSSIVAPVILILMGLLYFTLNIHQHNQGDLSFRAKKSKMAIIFLLLITMFFSPCLEIVTIYLAGGEYGFSFLIVISVVYLVLSSLGMVTMTWLSLKGFQNLNLYWLEHNEKRITGIVLIALGVISYLIKLH